MDDNNFWVVVWSLVSAVLIVIAVATGVSSAYSDSVMLKMVEKGATPIAARCGVYGADRAGNTVICVLISK